MQGIESEHAHNKFIRYSKGSFVGPLLIMRFTANSVKLAGSFHFGDEFLYLVSDVLGNREVHIKGSLVWNAELSKELESLGIKYVKVTKSRGIFKYVLDNDVKLTDFMDTLGKYNLLVSLKTGDISLTMKSSFPKPNKEFGPDFCKVTLPKEFIEPVLKEFAFDVEKEKCKRIDISHLIEVEDILLPDCDNFEEARRLAKRKGKLTRKVIVNSEEEFEKTIDFLV